MAFLEKERNSECRRWQLRGYKSRARFVSQGREKAPCVRTGLGVYFPDPPGGRDESRYDRKVASPRGFEPLLSA
jgi:hypothetical protein